MKRRGPSLLEKVESGEITPLEIERSAEHQDKYTKRQELKCLFCEATTVGIPLRMTGNRKGGLLAWYANGLYQTEVTFALCPKHQEGHHHREAWEWAIGG